MSSIPAHLAHLAQRSERSSKATRVFTPRVDLYTSAEAVLLYADLPGVSPEGLHLEVERGVLRLDASRSETVHYRRLFQLPEGLDTERITASLEHGVLTLTIPRAATHKTRSIPVE